MKRFYTLLLIGALATSAMAQVKARFPKSRYPIATIHDEGSDVSEARRRVGLHSSAPLTSFGSPKVPVILVQFQDKRFISGLPEGDSCITEADEQVVNEYFRKFANGLGDGNYYSGHGSRGAIMEYFRDQSDGLFTPQFQVFGPVTLANGYAHYGQNNGNGKDTNTNAFYTEAIQKAQALNVDWTVFDNDNNGSVDMAFFVFAGPGENADGDENTIWPHEKPSGGTIGGVSYGCYACCNETYQGKPDGIGVFIHELSHALGLPDFYDYDYKAYGLDYWDIMDSGCYCQSGFMPCGYSAYEKDFMGWHPLVTLDMDKPQHLRLDPVSLGGDGYKMVNPENANEYYIIENRQNKRWDGYIGRGTDKQSNHGMLVSHINYSQSAWTGNRLNTCSQETQRYTIVPADEDLYSYMNVNDNSTYRLFMISAASDPFPGLLNVTAMESNKQPVYTTTGETPGELNQPLRNIKENEDGSIELDYCPRGVNPPSTGLVEISTETPDATVYDLQGRKVEQRILPAGIYIINHRKVLVK